MKKILLLSLLAVCFALGFAYQIYPCVSQFKSAASTYDGVTDIINNDAWIDCNRGSSDTNDCWDIRYRLRIYKIISLYPYQATLIYNSDYLIQRKASCNSTANPHIDVLMSTYGPGNYVTYWEGYQAYYNRVYQEWFSGTQIWYASTRFNVP